MIIDGKRIAEEYKSEIKEEIKALGGRPPGLGFIVVGDHPPSQTYITMKSRACEDVGIHSVVVQLEEKTSENALISAIDQLNQDPSIDGILVQQPLPLHLNTSKIVEAILPEKDVDGFHPLNLGRLMLGDTKGFIPCTPLGIFHLMEKYQIDPDSKRVVILGRSNIVGKPLANLLLQKKKGCNATVTILHSKSQNFHQICAQGDIVIAALGTPELITEHSIKPGAIVIDVGINRIMKEGKHCIVGDVNFERVSKVASQITPVPGGVGPMTIVMLLMNTLKSRKRRS